MSEDKALFYERLFKWIFIISLSVTAITYFYKDRLPEPGYYDISILNPPVQTDTARDPFSIVANNQHYSIMPRFDYDLTGVVVTYNNASGFTDIWHYDIWKDFINVRDLCVIWGNNVSSGIYKKIGFTSDSWTCWYSWQDTDTFNIFKSTELSNNHLLTNNNWIKNRLMSAELGDVVHFKGSLVDYKNDDNGGERHTSIKRTDTGNGACEVVYIDEFDIIKKANPVLRSIYKLTKWLAILSLLGFIMMTSITPFKSRN